MTEQVTDKYAFLRENLQVLVAEAASKGGYNPRAKMIIDLLADYDALHAEAEALRAENERLNREASESMSALVNQRDAARTELEAAREMNKKLQAQNEALQQIVKTAQNCAERAERLGVTATPAPEVRCQTCDGTGDVHRADGEWLGECHCVKAEQGERQEAVVYAVHAKGMQVDHHCPLVSPDMAADYLEGCATALYTTPQPSPDVRALVEALRTVIGLLQHKAKTPLEKEAVRMADEALAACRQARQGGSHDR